MQEGWADMGNTIPRQTVLDCIKSAVYKADSERMNQGISLQAAHVLA